MEKLDLSSYAKEIKKAYDDVVSGAQSYAIFTTLKDSSLKPTTVSDGDIRDFVSEFEEGSVQFGIIRVNPFGSDVQKLILLGWCPDSAPIKSKVSYASNFSNVGKILHYHVEITARDGDDLDIDDIMKTVSNASGARYSIQSLSPSSASSGSKFKPTPKPASNTTTASKPSPVSTPTIIKPKPSLPPKKAEVDGWGDEEEIEERDFTKNPLQNLPSAYKPTKVDIDALRSGSPKIEKDEAPKTATMSINPSGGLTSLPKPKISNSVLSRFNQDVVKPEFGTKAPVFDSNPSRDSTKLVGGLSRNFGAQNGKTPAQLWAEKKGQYKEVANDEKPVNSEDYEKEIEQEDIGVNSAKAKFEKLQLEAEKEEQEEQEIKKHVSSFPPPPARTEPAASFPPPPARTEPVSSFPPPVSGGLNKFKEEEEDQPENDGWDEEEEEEEKPQAKEEPKPASAPVALPTRQLPPPPAEPTVEKVPEPTSKASGNKAIAEYEYEKDEDNEIGFVEGELIIDIEFVDEDWWQGTNASGETGLFPASYVVLQKEETIVESAPASAPAPSLPSRDTESEPKSEPTGPSAIAEFDYDASEDNELTFKEGDVITNIDKVDEDWWLGSFNGERKLFPANYVSLQ